MNSFIVAPEFNTRTMNRFRYFRDNSPVFERGLRLLSSPPSVLSVARLRVVELNSR